MNSITHNTTSSSTAYRVRSPRNRVTGAGFGKGYGRSSSYGRTSMFDMKYAGQRRYSLLNNG